MYCTNAPQNCYALLTRYDSRSTSLDSRMSLGSILFYSADNIDDDNEDSSATGDTIFK